MNLYLLATLVEEGVWITKTTLELHLWNSLRDHLANKDEQHGKSMLDAVCSLAREALAQVVDSCRAVGASTKRRLASMGILVRGSAGDFAFRHERMRDYFFAVEAVGSEMTVPALVAQIGNPRLKTVIPWIVQLAADASPGYCSRILTEVFDAEAVPSHLPRRAAVEAIAQIPKPSIDVAVAAWRAAIAFPEWAYDILGSFEKSTDWVMAFWQAGLFEAAISRSASAQEQHRAIEWLTGTVLDWAGKVKTDRVVVPEPLDALLPLLEASCCATASGDRWACRREANWIVAYLATQRIGNETVVSRLLKALARIGTDKYDEHLMESESAQEILRQAISAGGDAKRNAIELIEYHEAAGSRSLAGLLL